MQIGSADHRRYLHATVDDTTRYRMAGALTVHRDTDDVSPMFRNAKMRTGRAPAVPVSDKDGTYHDAWNREFKPKNPLQKDTCHDLHIHANSNRNNNRMERFNGGLRARDQDRARQGGMPACRCCAYATTTYARTWAWAAR